MKEVDPLILKGNREHSIVNREGSVLNQYESEDNLCVGTNLKDDQT